MVLGRQALKNRLRKIPKQIEDDLRGPMGRYAEQIVGQMRLLVPKKEGKLAASIGWTFGDAPAGALILASLLSKRDGLQITIYAGNSETEVTNKSGGIFQNAKLQEFGTKEMPANPYFFVVWRANRQRVRAGITRTVRKSLQNRR